MTFMEGNAKRFYSPKNLAISLIVDAAEQLRSDVVDTDSILVRSMRRKATRLCLPMSTPY